jgi:hypothetical protein
MSELKDKMCLVTGAGTGIGRGRLVEQGRRSTAPRMRLSLPRTTIRPGRGSGAGCRAGTRRFGHGAESVGRR